MFAEDAERTAQYFVKAHYSKAATSKSVQSYLNSQPLNVPDDWYQTCNDVANVGIPEATFPWEIGQEFGKIIETMELNCKKGDFEVLYAAALKDAISNIETMMSRSSYPRNPKFDYGE